jgi:TRIAD3 protein (E3 ubiquitin-protein ligase RNF216)
MATDLQRVINEASDHNARFRLDRASSFLRLIFTKSRLPEQSRERILLTGTDERTVLSQTLRPELITLFTATFPGIARSNIVDTIQRHRGVIPRAFAYLATKEWDFPAADSAVKVTDAALAIAVRVIEEEEAGVLCECCWGQLKSKSGNIVHCANGHVFCIKCLERHATELSEGRTVIRCIAQNGCGEVMDIEFLRKWIAGPLFRQLDAMTSHVAAVRAGLRLVFCCHCGAVASPDPGVTVMHCRECLTQTCVECGREAHPGKDCSDAREEELTARIVRLCPTCRVPMTKEDGCNKLDCPWCKTSMCFICKKVIHNGYDHFWRQREACPPDQCPLWLENETVRQLQMRDGSTGCVFDLTGVEAV